MKRKDTESGKSKFFPKSLDTKTIDKWGVFFGISMKSKKVTFIVICNTWVTDLLGRYNYNPETEYPGIASDERLIYKAIDPKLYDEPCITVAVSYAYNKYIDYEFVEKLAEKVYIHCAMDFKEGMYGTFRYSPRSNKLNIHFRDEDNLR